MLAAVEDELCGSEDLNCLLQSPLACCPHSSCGMGEEVDEAAGPGAFGEGEELEGSA